MFLGTSGTGGTFISEGLWPLPGDGLRKVRSVIDPELDCRCKLPGRCFALLPLEEAELRRTMRLVTVSPTGVGVETWVRRAAAAAALDRLGLDSRSLTNAFVAAREADALAGARWGCIEHGMSASRATSWQSSLEDARMLLVRRAELHLPGWTPLVSAC